MAHEKKTVETPVEYDPQYILQVKDLKKYFPIKGGMISKTVGHVKAVDGVTFNLKRGTTMGLVGESGCGMLSLREFPFCNIRYAFFYIFLLHSS